MTISLILFPEGEWNTPMLQEYRSWCWKTLFVPGEALTYKISGNKIIFLNNEDCLAFKLRFGL